MKPIVLGRVPPSQDPRLFSWWQQDLRRQPVDPACLPLSGSKAVDVAIVGGGYTGMWTALALKQREPKLSVAVLDAGRCGDGASSRNAGNVHGYWGAVATLRGLLGDDGALEVARLGTRAQSGIRDFAQSRDEDVWWREEGYLRVATNIKQEASIASLLKTAAEFGLRDVVRPLSRDELAFYCNSPAFRGGLLYSEGATVNPARLAAALRRAIIKMGVEVYENTAVTVVEPDAPSRVRTSAGEITARDVVLANYTGTLALPAVRQRTTIFSSFPVMSQPAADELAALNWTRAHGIADLRMFQHYFRRTLDGRILMGSGSGRMSLGTDDGNPVLYRHAASMERAARGLRRFFPEVADRGIAASWGWPIEVSSDRLPFFGSIPNTRIHYASGYSGHGVNATYIGGQCMASLVLRQSDQWSMSPFCRREQPLMPPEPFRFLGGRAIQSGILACEDAEDRGDEPPPIARFLAAVPKRLGLKIGTR